MITEARPAPQAVIPSAAEPALPSYARSLIRIGLDPTRRGWYKVWPESEGLDAEPYQVKPRFAICTCPDCTFRKRVCKHQRNVRDWLATLKRNGRLCHCGEAQTIASDMCVWCALEQPPAERPVSSLHQAGPVCAQEGCSAPPIPGEAHCTSHRLWARPQRACRRCGQIGAVDREGICLFGCS